MNANRFDAFARMVASRSDRRMLFQRAGGLGLGAALLSPFARGASAQESQATPTADPAIIEEPFGAEADIHYVAALEGTETSIAVIDRAGAYVDVYLCDGAEVAIWLEGRFDATTGAFTATRDDGVTVEATISADECSGTVSLSDGTTHDFTAPRAELPAGLYIRMSEENGETLLSRTIILPDGTAKGSSQPASTADARIISICRSTPFTAGDLPDYIRATFRVQAVNIGGTTSAGSLLYGKGQEGQQKGAMLPVTDGPVVPGKKVSFEFDHVRLARRGRLTFLVAFHPEINPVESTIDGDENGRLSFDGPRNIPEC